MAKHRSQWSLHRYHKLMEEGRGQGVLQDYKPWITIHDLASKGVVSRVWGQKTGRIHHFLSRNETAFFYILDASEKVFDIREQFPLLPVSETLEIARQAGIRHPRDTRSLYPYVMTSDFVITTKDGITKVRSVKLSKELLNPRTVEKLEIERRYWAKRRIEWRLVTEEQIDFQRAGNLEWIRRSAGFPERLPDHTGEDEVVECFLDLYRSTALSISDIARMIEAEFCLEAGLGITTFQYLLLSGRIREDLGKPLDLVSPRVKSEEKGTYSWIETFV